MNFLSRRIQADIRAFAPNVTTRVVNGQIWLEGTVDNSAQADRALRVAELYLPVLKPGDPLAKDPSVQALRRPLVQRFIVINPPPPQKQEKLVRITTHFVELSKDYKKVFGYKWQPGFTADPSISLGVNQDGSAGASAGGGLATFTGTISSLFPTLQTLQNAGYARVVKEGSLIVRSGQNASLNNELDIPFAAAGANNQVSTNVSKVGISVGVTPTILGQSQDIQLDLDIRQRNLAGLEGATPLISDNSVRTKIYVKSQESAAVAGVNSTDVQTSFNKDDPNAGSFSGQTKPLFTLLRTKNYLKKRGQFVIFVTPEIIESASEGTADLRKNFRVKVK